VAVVDPYLENEQQRQLFVDALHTQIGRPYIWGGQSPEQGYDCSGLIIYGLRQAGVHIEDMTS